ncbi:MAG: SAM-dependent methyltransferase [Odoribacter sp.]|nr:SAM-dependent methyltransferase [Odoribacter sp.]
MFWLSEYIFNLWRRVKSSTLSLISVKCTEPSNKQQHLLIRNVNQIITTSDGSHTIFVPELNEHYHSIHGAVQESELVYIKNGLGFCESNPLNIFEVGFGTGLNALLTAISGSNKKRKIYYTSIEKYPLPLSVINTLNHWSFAGYDGKEIFHSIHNSQWGSFEKITEYFYLKKIKCDIVKDEIEGKSGLIYFDAFGPDKQPEIWTRAVFEKISRITLKGGIFVTYSAKGEVKRLLKASGFKVSMLPGPPGKREMIRAIKL